MSYCISVCNKESYDKSSVTKNYAFIAPAELSWSVVYRLYS